MRDRRERSVFTYHVSRNTPNLRRPCFFFIIFALIAIVAALGVILSRKPVYSALFLLLNFGTLAAMYIMLQAQFLAMVQVIVYAGAIVVLFLFVMMLIGGGELSDSREKGASLRRWLTWPRVTALVLSVLLVGGLIYGLIAGTLAPIQGSAVAFGARQRRGHRQCAVHGVCAAL